MRHEHPAALPRNGADPTLRTAVRRGTWVSVWVNLCLSIAQVVLGLLARSQALVADGLHSFSDLLSDVLVLLAQHHGGKDADDDHPYGHLRFENAATLALGVLLMAVGAGMLWAAVVKLETPGAIARVDVSALWLALFTLLAKEALFRYLLLLGKRAQSSLLVANAWHSRSDAASSLVVAVGIVGNLVGYPLFDPIAALLVGLMIVRMGVSIGRRALDDLVDHAADGESVAAIRATLLGTPGVSGAHDMKTRKMGDLILVDVHLEVDGQLTVIQGHEIAEAARERVMAAHPVLDVMTHIDPAEHYRCAPTHAPGDGM